MDRVKQQIRCTAEEKAAWDRAAFPLTTAEWIRSIINPRAGMPPHPTPNKPKKAPPAPKTHCGYSGLPKNQCLCKRCSK